MAQHGKALVTQSDVILTPVRYIKSQMQWHISQNSSGDMGGRDKRIPAKLAKSNEHSRRSNRDPASTRCKTRANSQ